MEQRPFYNTGSYLSPTPPTITAAARFVSLNPNQPGGRSGECLAPTNSSAGEFCVNFIFLDPDDC
jgi:hypothetical protein